MQKLKTSKFNLALYTACLAAMVADYIPNYSDSNATEVESIETVDLYIASQDHIIILTY